MEPTSPNADALLKDQVDWSQCPQVPQDAGAFVRYLRGRAQPVTGYSAAGIQRLRGAATAAERSAAREALAAAATVKVGDMGRSSAILRLSIEQLQLADDPVLFQGLADHLLVHQRSWATGGWGTVYRLGTLLRALMPHPECPDTALVPFLSWLATKLPTEWAWARTWGAGMLGNTGHNWWLTTFSGFFQAGVLFPELRGFAKFASLGPEWLEREIRLLLQPDGFTKERSGYHWGTVKEFVECAHFARLNGVVLSADFEARLLAGVAVDWRTTSPDLAPPYVGDTASRRAPGSLLLGLRQGAARFGLGEAKWVAEALGAAWPEQPADRLTQFGEDLAPAYAALVPVAPAGPDTCLPDSGYYFQRLDWTPGADWVCMDAGARGQKITSHDHAAIFHLLLHSRGTPILVDNCSGPYGDSPARLWRIGSSAHNVATVDGVSAPPVETQWHFGGVVCPTILDWITAPAYSYFAGAHEGYRILPSPVPGTVRKLFYLRGDYWILIDRFETESAEAAHDYDLHFHLAAPASLSADGRVVTAASASGQGADPGPAGGRLLILPVAGARGEGSLEPNPHPLDGYDNPGHLCYAARRTGNALFVTLLVPFTGDAVPEVDAKLLEVLADDRVLAPWEATGLAISFNGRHDVYVDQHMQWNLPWQAGGCSGDGRLFHSQCAASGDGGRAHASR